MEPGYQFAFEAYKYPFEVTSNQTITDALHFPQRVFQDEFTVQSMIRQANYLARW
jgi:hypothetical protein